MPVYNPTIATSRGAAGESDDNTQTGKYNFANLYNLNRNDGAQQKQDMAGFQQRSDQIGSKVDDAQNSVREGDQAAADKAMASAVDDAKGLSNDTQGYSVSGSLQKQGIQGNQNRAATFYAGQSGQEAAKQVQQSYGNIYNAMQGVQKGTEGAVDRNIAQNDAANKQRGDEMAAQQQKSASDQEAKDMAETQAANKARAENDAAITKPAYDRLVSGGFMDPQTKKPKLSVVYQMFTGANRPKNMGAASAATKDILVSTSASRIGGELGIGAAEATRIINSLTPDQLFNMVTSMPTDLFDPFGHLDKDSDKYIDMMTAKVEELIKKGQVSGNQSGLSSSNSGGQESSSTRSKTPDYSNIARSAGF